MKKIFTLVVAAMTAICAFAQDYTHSAGLVVGSLNGLSYKYFISDELAIQADLGFQLGATTGNLFTSSSYAKDEYKHESKFNVGADANFWSFQLAPNFIWQKNITSFDWASLDFFVGGGISIGYAKLTKAKVISFKSVSSDYANNKEVYRSEIAYNKKSYKYAVYEDGKEVYKNEGELEEPYDGDNYDYESLDVDFGKFGVNAIAGVELALKGAPITIGIDFRPGYGLLFAGHDEDYKKTQEVAKEYGYEYSETAPVYHFFDWTLAATVRYTF